MKALLLVDLQWDFCCGGALEVPEGSDAALEAACLTSDFDIVVATQDWHPEHHRSFASNNPGAEIGDVVDGQVMWPDHCVWGSRGAEFHAHVRSIEHRICAIVRKGMNPEADSYSGFFDDDCRPTGLDGLLKSLNIDELHVCGLATDYCVKFTVLDALKLGYEVKVHLAACRAVNLEEGDEQRAVEEMRKGGAEIIS
jgi:nicotinamidase/pyrazinamidase